MVSFFLLTYFVSITPATAIGEASTSLYAYVPPGGESLFDNGENSATYIVVTATLDNTIVDIIDLDATIGDPTNQTKYSLTLPVVDVSDVDLSEYGVHLNMGQSRVIKVSYKSGVPDIDGAYFHVSANNPVIVYTGMAEGRAQADFVPSNDGTMVGNSFFVYLPDSLDAQSAGRYVYDLAVFAFEDNTNVSVYNISSTQTLVEKADTSTINATTSINFTSATLIEDDTLYPITPNQSLNRKPTLYLQALNGSGIERGYTYWVKADKNISVASVGILNDNLKDNIARDGGYQVPGISENPYRFGTGLAHTFYIQLNGPNAEGSTDYENEIYLINQNTTSTAYVTVEEFNPSTFEWEKIPGEDENEVTRNGNFTVLNSNITSIFSKKTTPPDIWDGTPRYYHQGLVRVTSKDSSGNPMDISVFAGVCMETIGSTSHLANTADVAAFASGNTGYGGSRETILYVPPPGYQPFFSDQYTHLYVYVHNNNTNISIQSWEHNNWTTVSQGEFTNFSKDQIIDYRFTYSEWTNGNEKDFTVNSYFHRIRVLSTERTTVQINNWNDNWASYVPGGNPPEFSVRMAIQSRYITINSIPAPRVRYSFDIINEAIGDIGSDLFDLTVTNTIPDGIDQRNIFWSIKSNMGGFEYDSEIYLADSETQQISNGTKYMWENSSSGLNVTAYAYNDGSGTVFVFNKTTIKMNEILSFSVNTPLNKTYHDGTDLKAGVMVINVKAEAENPFIGKVKAFVKLPGTIILYYISPGTIWLY